MNQTFLFFVIPICAIVWPVETAIVTNLATLLLYLTTFQPKISDWPENCNWCIPTPTVKQKSLMLYNQCAYQIMTLTMKAGVLVRNCCIYREVMLQCSAV